MSVHQAAGSVECEVGNKIMLGTSTKVTPLLQLRRQMGSKTSGTAFKIGSTSSPHDVASGASMPSGSVPTNMPSSSSSKSMHSPNTGTPSAATISAELQALSASDEHPMCAQQTSLWFMNKLDPSSVTYTVFFLAKLCSALNESAFRQALRFLVARHPSLRTTFFERDGQPMQKIHPFDPRAFVGDDASSSGDVDFQIISAESWTEAQMESALYQETHRPFDLSNGPVFRVRFFRQNANDQVGGAAQNHSGALHVMAHHIAIDGWSLDLLLSELGEIYHQCLVHSQSADQTSSWMIDVNSALPEVGSSMVRCLGAFTSNIHAQRSCTHDIFLFCLHQAQYAYYQRKLLASPEGDRLLNFWQRTLASPLPLLQLPTDRPRPPVATYRGNILSFNLPDKVALGLKALAKAEKSTVYMVLLARCVSVVCLLSLA